MSKLRDRFKNVTTEPVPEQLNKKAKEVENILLRAFPKDAVSAPYYDGTGIVFGDVSKHPTCKFKKNGDNTEIVTEFGDQVILVVATAKQFLLKWNPKQSYNVAGIPTYINVELRPGYLMHIGTVSVEDSKTDELIVDNLELNDAALFLSKQELLRQIIQLYNFTVLAVDADVCRENGTIEFSLLAENGKKIGSISMAAVDFDAMLDAISEANPDYQPVGRFKKLFFEHDEPKRIAYFPLPLSDLFQYIMDAKDELKLDFI